MLYLMTRGKHFAILVLLLLMQKNTLAFDSFEHTYLGDSFRKNFHGMDLAPNNQSYTAANPYPYQAFTTFILDGQRTRKIGRNLPAVSQQFLRVFPVGINGDVQAAYDTRGNTGSIYYDYVEQPAHITYEQALQRARARKEAALRSLTNMAARFTAYNQKIFNLTAESLRSASKEQIAALTDLQKKRNVTLARIHQGRDAAQAEHDRQAAIITELSKAPIREAFNRRTAILSAVGAGSPTAAQKAELGSLNNTLFKVLPNRNGGGGVDPGLRNYTQYSFGEVVAIAGDYIADPLQAISSVLYPRPPANQAQALETAFYAAYNYMKKYPTNPFFYKANGSETNILTELRGLFGREYEALIAHAGNGEHFSIHHQFMRDYTVAAKIKTMVSGVSTPHSTELLEDNYDHFGVDAHHVYSAGHKLACKVAKTAAFHRRQATRLQNPREVENHTKAAKIALNEAYAMEAFSLHFASDLFSAGHARTPRREASLVIQGLFTDSSPWGLLASKRVGLLANAQHDEDGTLGLQVRNKTGSTWEMFGDYSLFDYRSALNRSIAMRALETSVGEIESCFTRANYKPGMRLLRYVPSRVSSDHSPLTRIGRGNVFQMRKSYDVLDSEEYTTVNFKDAVAALGGRDKKWSFISGLWGPVMAFFTNNGVLNSGRITKKFSRYLDYVEGYKGRTHRLKYIYCYDTPKKYTTITLAAADYIQAIKKDGNSLSPVAYDPTTLEKAFYFPYSDSAIPIRENTINNNRSIIYDLKNKCRESLGADRNLIKIVGQPATRSGGAFRYYPLYGLNAAGKLVEAVRVPPPPPPAPPVPPRRNRRR